MNRTQGTSKHGLLSKPFIKPLAIILAISLTVSSSTISLFLFNSQITTFILTYIERLLTWTGLGITIVVGWGIVGVMAIKSQRVQVYLQSNYRNLIGCAGITTAIWGVMHFFTPQTGFPGWTDISTNISLGGIVGAKISGPTPLYAAIRIILISLSSIALIKPSSIKTTWQGLRKLSKISLHLVAKITAVIASMYQRNKRDQSLKLPTINVDNIEIPPEILTPHMRESDMIQDEFDPETDEEEVEADRHVRPGHLISTINIIQNDRSVIEGTVESKEDEIKDELFHIGKKNGATESGALFNKYWKIPQQDINIRTTEQVGAEEPERAEVKNKIGEKEYPHKKAWNKPSYELLSNLDEGGISKTEIQSTSNTIKQTFAEYNIEIEVDKVRPGPTVTMYGIEPGWVRKHKRVRVKDPDGNPKNDKKGKPIYAQREEKTRVSVDHILRREKDLSLALKTPSLRIETPVMGESLLGIEVPNPSPSLVTLRKVMESGPYRKLARKTALPVALGKGSDGEPVVFDLARMPHLLIAGATGSGKSVCINAIVSCLIVERTPAELQMLLIDPKRVELTPYNGIPHLITPVVVETDKVVHLLKGLIREMMDRYRRMEDYGARNIESFNRSSSEKMPYIVVAIDELADLMMTAAFDIEQSLCRLAQLGRATGIHLIIATQRPSVDVITGLIKANFPSRISFGVTSQVDSRTIIDTIGADKLLGKGDMLYLPIDGTRPTRVQNVFISDAEIDKIVGFWSQTSVRYKPAIELQINNETEEDLKIPTEDSSKQDALLDKAIELAHRHAKLSTSLLQRRLRIGYPRAARLMDELEDIGIVGPSDGSKSRDVIISTSLN